MRLCTSHACNAPSSLPNIGNAVNTASATVKNGTSAIVVVNVRLLAVSAMRSSRKRSRNVDAVACQGTLERSVSAWFHFIAAMMPFAST